jgi:hypothetical protein
MASQRYPESLFLKLEAGTIARIDDGLDRFEARSHMVREAIEREIKRRARRQLNPRLYGPRARRSLFAEPDKGTSA